MQALILAAGRGSRMGAKTSELPKCLLEVGGRALIEHQLETLAECGVGPVGIVVGYCEDQIRELVGIRAEYIRNPRWRQTNSLYSFWVARDWVDGPVLVLNSDVLLDPRLIERMLRMPGDALAFDSGSGAGAEQMKVRVKDGRLVAMSKSLPEIDVAGENVGMLRFEAATARLLFERAEGLVQAGHENDWLGAAVCELAREVPIRAVDVAGLPWGEIDFAYDLDRARKHVWPAIRSNGRHRAPKRVATGLLGLVLACALLVMANSVRIHSVPVSWEPLEIGAVEAVSIASETRAQRWWQLDAGSSIRVPVTGPGTFRVESRMLVGPEEARGRYALDLSVDGVPLKWDDHQVRASETWQLRGERVGKRHAVKLELPEGQHQLRIGLVASRPASCLIRVAQRILGSEDD